MMQFHAVQPGIQETSEAAMRGNPQKLNAEMQKLYSEEGVNPMSGCLWSPDPVPPSLSHSTASSAVRLTRMMCVTQEALTPCRLTEQGWDIITRGRRAMLRGEIASPDHPPIPLGRGAIRTRGEDRGLMNIDCTFIGLNLGQQPTCKIWTSRLEQPSRQSGGLFLIPIVSAGLSWLSMKISNMSPTPAITQAAATKEDHDDNDAAHVALDLLRHARRHGHLLDRQQRPRHDPRPCAHHEVQEAA